MPQMAPISWLILFFMFSFIFLLFNILNYFCFYYNKTTSNNNNNNNNNMNKNNFLNLNWKW